MDFGGMDYKTLTELRKRTGAGMQQVKKGETYCFDYRLLKK
jgi:translation elongation factor EF-Ts